MEPPGREDVRPLRNTLHESEKPPTDRSDDSARNPAGEARAGQGRSNRSRVPNAPGEVGHDLSQSTGEASAAGEVADPPDADEEKRNLSHQSTEVLPESPAELEGPGFTNLSLLLGSRHTERVWIRS